MWEVLFIYNVPPSSVINLHTSLWLQVFKSWPTDKQDVGLKELVKTIDVNGYVGLDRIKVRFVDHQIILKTYFFSQEGFSSLKKQKQKNIAWQKIRDMALLVNTPNQQKTLFYFWNSWKYRLLQPAALAGTLGKSNLATFLLTCWRAQSRWPTHSNWTTAGIASCHF